MKPNPTRRSESLQVFCCTSASPASRWTFGDRLRGIAAAAPPSISDSFLAPLIGAFQASYPNVRVQVFITDRIVDHIAEGVDLAFRVDPRLKDSSLVARKILTYRHQLLASPAYLAACKRQPQKAAGPARPPPACPICTSTISDVVRGSDRRFSMTDIVNRDLLADPKSRPTIKKDVREGILHA